METFARRKEEKYVELIQELHGHSDSQIIYILTVAVDMLM